MKPIVHKLTIDTLIRSGKSWLQGNGVTVRKVVAYYRKEYGLSSHRVSQLRRGLATS